MKKPEVLTSGFFYNPTYYSLYNEYPTYLPI